MRDLLDAGMHYGHRVSRWNPKMAPYIYGKRNLIHIIDLRETMRGLITAYRLITRVVAAGKDVLMVGTKRHARDTIKAEALRAKMHFVNERWLGGTLTNYRYIRSRLNRLFDLEELFESGNIYNYTKKEASLLRRERNKIHRNLEGIRNMESLPGVVYIVDPRREKIAVAEAKRMRIPTICLADTDCDPDMADVIIPGNDDAMRAVELVTRHVAEACLEGQKRRRDQAPIQPLARKPATVPSRSAEPEKAEPTGEATTAPESGPAN
jgi:small subunit ribosomal protein S2